MSIIGQLKNKLLRDGNMSSFGDGNKKTRIEQELSWIAKEYYSNDFHEDKEAQRKFLLDVIDVLRYICGE